jgi:transcriptional regulator with XRE-family HTH domain
MPRTIRHQKQVGVEVTELTVDNRLVDALTARELSQEECARRIRISHRQLHRIISGAVPRLDVAMALEVVLATPLKELFTAVVKTRPAR